MAIMIPENVKDLRPRGKASFISSGDGCKARCGSTSLGTRRTSKAKNPILSFSAGMSV